MTSTLEPTEYTEQAEAEWSHPAPCVVPAPRLADLGEQDSTDPEGDDPAWDLVRSVQAGNMAAYSEIYTSYEPIIRRFVRSKSWGRRDDATIDDLVSDTFCQALDVISRSDPAVWPAPMPGSTLRGWLVSISRSRLLKFYERAETRRAVPVSDFEVIERVTTSSGDTDVLINAYGNPEHEVLAQFDRQALAFALSWAIARLCPSERHLVEAYALQGRSYTQLAQEMHRTRVSLWSLRDQAFERLADHLAPSGRGRAGTEQGEQPRYALAMGRARTAYTRAQHRRAALLLAPWTRARAARLGVALGMSTASFAAYLGVAHSTVLGWARPDGAERELAAATQALLDIVLARATPAQRARFDAPAVAAEQAAVDPSLRCVRVRPGQAAQVAARVEQEQRAQQAQDQAWRVFLARWQDLYGQRPVTARQVWDSAHPGTGTDPWNGAVPAPVRPTRQPAKWLGQRLAEHVDQDTGDVVLRCAWRRDKSREYWVERLSGQRTGQSTEQAGVA